jgi:hypothetical protein
VTHVLLYPCEHAGCSELVRTANGRCKRHARKQRAGATPHRLTPCLAAGCPRLVEGGGYCKRCARRGGSRRGASRRGGRRREPWSSSSWTARAAALVRKVGRCQRCGATEDLVAHHVEYDPTRPGVVDSSSPLEVVCRSCHGKLHRAAEQAARSSSSVRGSKGSTTPRRSSAAQPGKKTASSEIAR